MEKTSEISRIVFMKKITVLYNAGLSEEYASTLNQLLSFIASNEIIK